MNDAEDVVALVDRVDDDAHRVDVEDLLEGAALDVDLAVEMCIRERYGGNPI